MITDADAVATELPNGFLRSQVAAALSPKFQELILLPTERCNFRCTYCYEDFELGRMSEVTQVAIERFVERRAPELEDLRFSWFGGEPLLAKDIVLRLSRHAQKVCASVGTRFRGGLTTNAYLLTKDLAADLLGCGQDFFQITLDGWRDVHDEVRKRADGKGTFDRIWRNLLEMRNLSQSFEVVVRIHVRRDNQENLAQLMREYAVAFEGDRRYRLDFQHLRDMGGDGGKSVKNAVTLDELTGIESTLRQEYKSALGKLRQSSPALRAQSTSNEETVPQQRVNAGESAGSQRASDRILGAPYICYAGKANSLLIRANGRIAKCTVAFDDDRNDIGHITDDGKVVVDNKKFSPWIRGLGTLDPDDTNCPIRGIPRLPAESSTGAKFPKGRVVPIQAVPLA